MGWDAWEPDWLTWSWVAWIAAFAVLETVALLWFRGNSLTSHLRPVLNEHPLAWFLALGGWLWHGVHFLAPRIEASFLEWLVR